MSEIKFYVASNPAVYGADATTQDVQEFANFAYQYLLQHGYDEVAIEYVETYPPDGDDEQAPLRKEVWSAFRP